MEEYVNFYENAIIITSISTLIVSSFVTFFYLKNKCNLGTLLVYIIFNFTMVVLASFPIVISFDFFLSINEKLKIYDNYNYDKPKNFVKKAYIVSHWIFYSLNDFFIPFCIEICSLGTNYIRNFSCDKEKRGLHIKRKKIIHFLKSLKYIIIFIIIAIIACILCTIFLPEPTLEKKKKIGWVGFYFNYRDLIQLLIIFHDAFFFFIFMVLDATEYLFGCLGCWGCFKKGCRMRKHNIYYWIGIIEEYNNTTKYSIKLNSIKSFLLQFTKNLSFISEEINGNFPTADLLDASNYDKVDNYDINQFQEDIEYVTEFAINKERREKIQEDLIK